jgi:DMSO/TMAO reductase YedYZ heme-binding membrane subunit
VLFIVSLVGVCAITLIFHKALHKMPWLFYLLTTLVVLYLFGSYLTNTYEWWPEWFLTWFVSSFARGSLSTACFVVVMYLGVLPAKMPGVKALRKVRAELSIIGCLLAIGHVIYYGIYYFPRIFVTIDEPLPVPYAAATWITLVLVVLMIPLLVTSLRAVRRRMRPTSWKKVQRLAYPFCALLYAHVLILFFGSIVLHADRAADTWVNLVVYSVVFLAYFIARPLKYLRERRSGPKAHAAGV